jgi:hypothetical protein
MLIGPPVYYYGDDPVDGIIRAKWSIDGAKSLQEAARYLREFAYEVQRYHDAGYQLRGAIGEDYGFIFHPDGGVGPLGQEVQE